MTGSSLPSRASWVRSRANSSSTGGLGALLGPGVVLVTEEGERFLPHLVEASAEGLEDLRGDRLAFLHEPEEEMLGPDVVVAELPGFLDGKLEDALGLGVKGTSPKVRVLGKPARARSTSALTVSSLKPRRWRNGGGDALAVAIRPRRMCSVPTKSWRNRPRLFPRQDDDPPRSLRKSLEHLESSLSRVKGSLGAPSRPRKVYLQVLGGHTVFFA
jgi:hypothetical protein